MIAPVAADANSAGHRSGAFIPALILPGFAYLYRVNNGLTRAEAAGALRGCALMGMTFLLAAHADKSFLTVADNEWFTMLFTAPRPR